MATFLNKLVEKLTTFFPNNHPASVNAIKAGYNSYTNSLTGANTVIKNGSIFKQGLDNS